MSTTYVSGSSTRADAPPRDLRGFWRILLAVVAPIPVCSSSSGRVGRALLLIRPDEGPM